MGEDYYKILQVDKKAKDDDLNKAYSKFAAKFKQISQAYDVLSDPRKRAVYDQYGEQGLKGQVPQPGAGGPNVFRSNSRNADDIFAEFFGTPSGGGPNVIRSDSGNAIDIFTEFFGTSSGGGGGGGGGMRGASSSDGMYGDDPIACAFREMSMDQNPRKAAPIVNKLPCSLEELYKGTTKKMKISREISVASGRNMKVEEILNIDLKPGWKKGTKITFEEKGNVQPNLIPADIIFIVDEKPHSLFTRDGNDLFVTQKISVVEALTDCTVHLTTLDGRNLTIPITNMIHPGYEEVVPREGMPIPKDPSTKGSLRIKFNIIRTRLTAEQKTGIKRLLAP